MVERLDDVEDDVRSIAITNIKNLFTNLPEEMLEDSHSAVFCYFVKALLPYIDDDNLQIQQGVYGNFFLKFWPKTS